MYRLKPNLCAHSVQELFYNLDAYIDQIPEKERWNLHYTLCECVEEKDVKARVFRKQNVIPFDIDSIDVSRINDYIDPVLQVLGGINPGDCAIISSGNGIHFILGTDQEINNSLYFKQTLKYYKAVCERINRKLQSLDLPGHADHQIWSAGHTLRLPGTKNIKTPETGYKNKNSTTDCKLISKVINPIPDLTIEKIACPNGLPIEESVKVGPRKHGSTMSCDSEGILSGCLFLQHCRDNPTQLEYMQWFLMLAVVSHLEEGHKLGHELSEKHPDYDFDETETKLSEVNTWDRAPMCTRIEQEWDGCKDCKFYRKCHSPIDIKSENYIATRQTGFRTVKFKKGANGELEHEPGAVCVEDLAKYYKEQHPYVATESRAVYSYNGTHWDSQPHPFIEGFCQTHVGGKPATESDRLNFRKYICATEQRWDTWFTDTTFQKVNLKNGVLDVSGDEPKLLPHSTDYGFMSCLDYDYDPKAQCPSFDRFLDDITLNRKELKDNILEFLGYAFTNEECKYDKALIMLGEGSNGKSTLMDTMKRLAGTQAFSSLSMADFANEQQRAGLRGKLFNISDEAPSKRFVDSAEFKNMTSGGTLRAKVVYQTPFDLQVRAKLIMACNNLPRTFDTSHGFLRRLLLIPFDAKFEDGKNRDVNIREKLFAELPGILNRILEGAYRLRKQGRFTTSEIITQAVSDYKYESDPISSYAEERLAVKPYEKHDSEGVSIAKLYKDFKHYCEENGFKSVPTKVTFSKGLASSIKDCRLRRKRVGSHRERILTGVFINEMDHSAF